MTVATAAGSARRPRIFVGMMEIAGYYSRLAGELEAAGYDVQFITIAAHPFAYSGPARTRWVRLLQHATSRRAATSKRRVVGKVFWIAVQQVAIGGIFLDATFRNDVFIFGFGESLLPRNADLWVLRALGKTVIVNMAHGSELRPPYLDGTYQSVDGKTSPGAAEYMRLARGHVRRLRRVHRHADYVIGAPYTSQFSRWPMINSFALGIPSLAVAVDSPARAKPGHTRIVHAPSHPAVKGTARIREAIDALRARGHLIELVEVQGRPHGEVLQELAACDFVIDQLYSDTPMAGLATEAASFGKPAVVGGYELEALRRHVPEGMFPPSHICHPDDLESAVERLLVDRDYRSRLGEEARRFVTTAWSPPQVARRYLRLIQGEIPAAWWFDPLDVCYVYGGGQSEARTRDNVRAIVDACGLPGLELGMRPDVERALLELVGLEDAGFRRPARPPAAAPRC
jgi:hypothetical protein